MTGYSGTPLWKKLGYRDGLSARVEGEPKEYFALLALPAGTRVVWLSRPRKNMAFVHLFARDAAKLKERLRAHRRDVAPDGVIWVSWPKKSSGVATTITEDVVRDIALPMGLVDIKVCAVDQTWSGLKLMIRKGLR
jgi:hypothetical protein